MKKEYIADCLQNYSDKNSVRLHMPGHKGVGEGILSSVYSFDVTELSFSDNLADPSGVILLAEKDIAQICGAKRSRILTGGSTLGVLASVFSVKERGKKMIIQRSSHKSVYNALELFGIEPIILNEEIIDGVQTGKFLNDYLFDCADNDVIGALLTSPNYFGKALDLKNIKSRLTKNNKLLIVDGAHGGHFAFDNPTLYCGRYADVWVDGAHKTMQTLTQGAILHLNDLSLLEKVNEGLSIFSTSSPSYLIMASVESGVKRYQKIKQESLKTFSLAKQKLTCGLQNLGFELLPTDDNLKVSFLCKKGEGYYIGEKLEEAGIFAELVNHNVVLFMLGYSFNEDSAQKVLSAINLKSEKSFEKESFSFPIPCRKQEYVLARKGQGEYVLLSEANGRVCAQNAGVFPPCYPVITAGEVFDNSVIRALSVKSTFGVLNGKVKVVKE